MEGPHEAGTQVCEEVGTADVVGAPRCRDMDGWELSFTCALPFQSFRLCNALSPLSKAGPPKTSASWFFHLWAIFPFLWPGPSELLAPNTMEQRRWEVTSKITEDKGPCLPPPLPFLTLFQSPCSGKSHLPYRTALWRGPDGCLQPPVSKDLRPVSSSLRQRGSRLSTPVKAGSPLLTSCGLESC